MKVCVTSSGSFLEAAGGKLFPDLPFPSLLPENHPLNLYLIQVAPLGALGKSPWRLVSYQSETLVSPNISNNPIATLPSL